ncbi:MAG: PfkB family carbohydrate kinase [Nocardioides sp.]|nr:PfkB family carbohydrate kinase [Nocardioides sp.]
MIGLADVIKLSDEDLGHLWPGVSVPDAAAAMIETGRTAVVVTRGADGSSWFGAQGRVDVAAASGPVGDTIGAGDTFAAGMIAALTEREALGSGGRERLRALGAADWGEVLEVAARAAAVTVSREGADPPYAAELHA